MTDFKTFYGTFGQGHLFKNHYVRIEAPDEVIARHAMQDQFLLWSSVYDENDWPTGEALRELFPGGEIFAFRVLDEHLNYEHLESAGPKFVARQCSICGLQQLQPIWRDEDA